MPLTKTKPNKASWDKLIQLCQLSFKQNKPKLNQTIVIKQVIIVKQFHIKPSSMPLSSLSVDGHKQAVTHI
jgi:hypothetical protein